MRETAGDVKNVSLVEQECPEIGDDRFVLARCHIGDGQGKFLGWTRETPLLAAVDLGDQDVVVVGVLQKPWPLHGVAYMLTPMGWCSASSNAPHSCATAGDLS